MEYYVLKHSAKGTTWGDHKYIRKEGNRYIYPEDVEGTKEERLKNAIVGPDGDKKSGFAYNYLKQIDPEAAEKYLNEDIKTEEKNVRDESKTIGEIIDERNKFKEQIKNIDDVELYRMLQRLNKMEEMNNNRPVSEIDKSVNAEININNWKKNIKQELNDRNERNKILSEAKSAADDKRSEEAFYKKQYQKMKELKILAEAGGVARALRDIEAEKRKEASRDANRTNYMPAIDRAKQQSVKQKENAKHIQSTSAAAGYIKRKDDPADRYRLVPNKTALAKKRANLSDEVSREIHGNKEKNSKYLKDLRRANAIKTYKDTIKGKDTSDGTTSLDNLKRAQELASKRKTTNQRNRYVTYYNAGPLRIRQDTSPAARSRSAIYEPETKIKVVKKKKK